MFFEACSQGDRIFLAASDTTPMRIVRRASRVDFPVLAARILNLCAANGVLGVLRVRSLILSFRRAFSCALSSSRRSARSAAACSP